MIKRIINQIQTEYYYFRMRKLLKTIERENKKNAIS
jgi:hypothetical protein